MLHAFGGRPAPLNQAALSGNCAVCCKRFSAEPSLLTAMCALRQAWSAPLWCRCPRWGGHLSTYTSQILRD